MFDVLCTAMGGAAGATNVTDVFVVGHPGKLQTARSPTELKDARAPKTVTCIFERLS